MSKEAIKTFNGKIIGYIETKPNGDKEPQHHDGRTWPHHRARRRMRNAFEVSYGIFR